VDAARELGVELVVSMGALLADVPHTRPVQITGIAADPELVARLGFSETRYEGPTGIVGVLHDTCARAGLASASLWAPVPHYVATVPSPKATLALLGHLEGLLEIRIDTSELEEAAVEYERRLDEAVAGEPEVRALVERLERQVDDQEISFRNLPSGDSIAREFERFLKEQGEEK
jgi:predicted ATP-grasp superfamily ATP-dependent carboligase